VAAQAGEVSPKTDRAAHHGLMSRSSTRLRDPQPSVFASLLVPVTLVALAGVVGWILLVTVKWLIVTLLFAIGIALVIVPIAAGSRIVGPAVGEIRRRRIGQLVTAVLLGVAFIVLGVVVSHHGWLLIVVPAAVVLIARGVGKVSERRAANR